MATASISSVLGTISPGVALGPLAVSAAGDCVAVGTSARASAAGATAVGAGAEAFGSGIAVGMGASAAASAVALGAGSTAPLAGFCCLGATPGDDGALTLTVDHAPRIYTFANAEINIDGSGTTMTPAQLLGGFAILYNGGLDDGDIPITLPSASNVGAALPWAAENLTSAAGLCFYVKLAFASSSSGTAVLATSDGRTRLYGSPRVSPGGSVWLRYQLWSRDTRWNAVACIC